MDYFISLNVKQYQKYKIRREIEESIIDYTKKQVIISNLISCGHNIELLVKRDLKYISEYGAYSGVDLFNGKPFYNVPLENTLYPIVSSNILKKSTLPTMSFFNYKKIEAIIYCMFWKTTVYDDLLNYYCDSKNFYESIARTKNYRKDFSFEKYKEIRNLLISVVNEIRGKLVSEGSFMVQNILNDIVRNLEFGGSEEEEKKTGICTLYRNLVRLLDFSDKYKTYTHEKYIWSFTDEAINRIKKYSNIYNKLQKYASTELGVVRYEYKGPIKETDFVITNEFLTEKDKSSLQKYKKEIGETRGLLTNMYELPNLINNLDIEDITSLHDIELTETRYREWYSYLPEVIVISIKNPISLKIDLLSIDGNLDLIKKDCSDSPIGSFKINGIIFLNRISLYLAEIRDGNNWRSQNSEEKKLRTTKDMLEYHNKDSDKVYLLFAFLEKKK